MKTRHLTNQDVPMPIEYEEMMRHYLPANTPKAVIVDAWKHNARHQRCSPTASAYQCMPKTFQIVMGPTGRSAMGSI